MIQQATIAIDLDDVLGSENDAVRQFVNERYGLNHTPKDYLVEGDYGTYWERIWEVDGEESKKRYEDYVSSGLKYQHAPIKGSINAINHLKQKYHLVIVTSRGDRHLKPTHEWLDQYFPEAFRSVEFVPLWGASEEITKAYICKNIGASYLIDDHFDHCKLAAEEGIIALLFGEYGWNRNKTLPNNVIRVKDWQKVLEYFDNRSRSKL